MEPASTSTDNTVSGGSHPAIEALIGASGEYVGSGINHDDEAFEARLSLSPTGDGNGVLLRFVATGVDGTLYHDETTLIGPSVDGDITYYPISNNVPVVVPHVLTQCRTGQMSTHLEFSTGNLDASDQFRETIAIELDSNGIEYVYFWGLPRQPFAERSRLRLTSQ